MSQHYSDPKRANDPHALPDLETFEVGRTFRGCPLCETDETRAYGSSLMSTNHTENHVGWYWHACFPGCLPDGEPSGPFDSEADALADARDGMDVESTGCQACDDKELRHADYPHDPGYLDGCAACEDHCHCGRADGQPIEGRAACVFSECDNDDDESEATS